MDLRGLSLLAGILAASLAAGLVIDRPGLYLNVTADRVLVNASDVVIDGGVVRGSAAPLEPPPGHGGYRLRPALGCVAVVGARNVTVRNLEVSCTAGLLVLNSTGVRLEGLRLAGAPELPVYLRGVGIYVANSSGVSVKGVSLAHFHDGIYVEYSRQVEMAGVEVHGSRYGIHVMFSRGVVVRDVEARDNYVGAAVMYSTAEVSRVEAVGNREWAEGYGIFVAEVQGAVEDCVARDNVHGIYVLYWGGTRLNVTGCTVEGNYFGITLYGRNATGVAFRGNVIRGNVVQVIHLGVGEDLPNAAFAGNLWGGHASDAPYVYSSAYSQLMSATLGQLAFLAASPVRPLLDSLAAAPLAVDPTPRPDDGPPSWLLLLALAPLALLWRSR